MSKAIHTIKKKVASKKVTSIKTASKLPFYAHLLSTQEATRLKATSKDNDSFKTDKYPNDDADVIYDKKAGTVFSFQGAATGKKADQVVITLKYPSDNDEAITLKAPSDSDEVIATIEKLKTGNFRTTRFPNDEYALATASLLNFKPEKGLKIKPTRPAADVVHTLKYPSDRDEVLIEF